jgi:hypothetical protein
LASRSSFSNFCISEPNAAPAAARPGTIELRPLPVDGLSTTALAAASKEYCQKSLSYKISKIQTVIVETNNINIKHQRYLFSNILLLEITAEK